MADDLVSPTLPSVRAGCASAHAVNRVVEARKLSTVDAAKVLGIMRVSALHHYKPAASQWNG